MDTMRYATFSLLNDDAERIGVWCGDRLLDLQKLVGPHWEGSFPGAMLEFIQAGPEVWRGMALEVEKSASRNLPPDASLRGEDVRLRAPLPHPRKNVFCLG